MHGVRRLSKMARNRLTLTLKLRRVPLRAILDSFDSDGWLIAANDTRTRCIRQCINHICQPIRGRGRRQLRGGHQVMPVHFGDSDIVPQTLATT